MTDLALQSIASNLGTNWHFITPSSGFSADDAGYYIHRSRVYLAGLVANAATPLTPPSAPVSATVLAGLPPAICPATDQAVVIYTETTDPATPGITPVPTTLSATVTTAGDLVLDSLPEYINAAPNGLLWNYGPVEHGETTPVADFSAPLFYGLVLGTVTWPLAGELADTWTGVSMASFLDGDFDDIDATIAVHDSRVHLAGHVRANVTGASLLTDSLPDAYKAGLTAGASTKGALSGHADYPVVVTMTARVSGFPLSTVRTHGDNPVPIAPPSRYPQQTFGTGYVLYRGDLGGAIADGSSIIAGLNSHPSGFPGDLRRQAVINSLASASWDHGTYDCATHSGGVDGVAHCRSPGASGSCSLDITSQLAAFYPAPDWWGVQVLVFGDSTVPGTRFENHDIGCSTAPAGGCGPTALTLPTLQLAADASCGLLVGYSTHSMPLTPTASFTTDGTSTNVRQFGGWGLSGFPAGPTGGFNGFIQRPSAGMTYADDPYNLGATCLWRASEVPKVYTLTATGTTNTGGVAMKIRAIPFWDARKVWFMEGDILDLTGAGWQSPFTAPSALMTTLSAGPGLSGIHRTVPMLGFAGSAAEISSGALPDAGSVSGISAGTASSGMFPLGNIGRREDN